MATEMATELSTKWLPNGYQMATEVRSNWNQRATKTESNWYQNNTRDDVLDMEPKRDQTATKAQLNVRQVAHVLWLRLTTDNWEDVIY